MACSLPFERARVSKRDQENTLLTEYLPQRKVLLRSRAYYLDTPSFTSLQEQQV